MNLENLDSYLALTRNMQYDIAEVHSLVGYLDLTSLNLDDTEDNIRSVCTKAVTAYGPVAAVCIYPQFISLAKQLLQNTNIKVATVCNFPSGTLSPQVVLNEISQALDDGADEIDMVIPFNEYVTGNAVTTIALVEAAKSLCPAPICLKVILEAGLLNELGKVYQASLDAIQAGADFIKTSTGKALTNATPEFAFTMLSAIKETGKLNVGFKAAGGVRTVEQALGYVAIAKALMGEDWVTPQHFRIGASGLLDAILATKAT